MAIELAKLWRIATDGSLAGDLEVMVRGAEISIDQDHSDGLRFEKATAIELVEVLQIAIRECAEVEIPF